MTCSSGTPPIPARSSRARPTLSCHRARRPIPQPGVPHLAGSSPWIRRMSTSATTPPSSMAESDPIEPVRAEPGQAGPEASAFEVVRVARLYDRIAGAYAGRFGDDLRPGTGDRAFLDVALASAPASGPVLDLGCGPGQIAAIAVDSGMPAIGADISLGMLAVARRRVPLAAFIA